jgi:chromosome segregation ATPase
MSECADMRALRAEYDKIKQHAEGVVSQNVELRQERDGLREQLEAESRSVASIALLVDSTRGEAAMRQREHASLIADANAARERAERSRDIARQERNEVEAKYAQVAKLFFGEEEWTHDEVRGRAVAAISELSAARKRARLWKQAAEYERRLKRVEAQFADSLEQERDGLREQLANWKRRAEQQASANLVIVRDLAEARQEVANLQRRAEHAAQELEDALAAVEAVTKERDQANKRAEYAEGCNRDLADEIKRRHGIGGELIAARAERVKARQEADLLRQQVVLLRRQVVAMCAPIKAACDRFCHLNAVLEMAHEPDGTDNTDPWHACARDLWRAVKAAKEAGDERFKG